MSVFAVMKRPALIGFLLLLALAACHSPQREARRMVARAERLFDTLPDSTASLIDSVLRMPVYFGEKQRMDMALLQAEALLGDRGQEIPPLMDDDFFDDKPFFSTSPELERAADYYAKKKQYAKAAHAALYSGFVQQHYNDKTAAMQSFKEAEHYGRLAGDSLAVARAEYRLGRMLYYDGMNHEALVLLKASEIGLGDHQAEKAIVQNIIAACYLMLGNFENAENYLQNSMMFAEKRNIEKVKRKALNNYAVLFQLQGEYDKAITCLRQVSKESILDDTELLLLSLNLGDVFFYEGKIDSAAYYYKHMESLLPTIIVKLETQLAVYDALYRFAESQGNNTLALRYRDFHEKLLYEIMQQQQEQNVYRIQQQYDYVSLQNEMNQKLIQRQRFITIVSVLFIVGLAALAVSQIRLAKIRKQEAEAKANLFHFMQQNKKLVQQHEEYARLNTDLMQKQTEKEKVYQELMQENEKYKHAYQSYAKLFSNAKNREQAAVMKLAIYLKNTGSSSSLDGLKRAVFDAQTPWETTYKIFDTLYPNVRENLAQQHPDLNEMEQKDFILSFFGVSRQDEADMLGTTVHTVDKLRQSVREKFRETTNEA